MKVEKTSEKNLDGTLNFSLIIKLTNQLINWQTPLLKRTFDSNCGHISRPNGQYQGRLCCFTYQLDIFLPYRLLVWYLKSGLTGASGWLLSNLVSYFLENAHYPIGPVIFCQRYFANTLSFLEKIIQFLSLTRSEMDLQVGQAKHCDKSHRTFSRVAAVSIGCLAKNCSCASCVGTLSFFHRAKNVSPSIGAPSRNLLINTGIGRSIVVGKLPKLRQKIE